MITITGLTDRQKNLMDLLWNCSSLEQVQTLINALPTATDRVDARGLVMIATHETIEQELGLEEYKDAALGAIRRAMQ
jgi:hypothetical protein